MGLPAGILNGMDDEPKQPLTFPRRVPLSLKIVSAIFLAIGLIFVVAACGSALEGEWRTFAKASGVAAALLAIAYWYQR
jgi:hypothetical protein